MIHKKYSINYFCVSILFLLFFLSFTSSLLSQTYILNEDFSSASGTTPPTGWTNTNITGNSTDVWHFDNPGNRAPGFPIIGTFAIFDSENYSQSGGPEKAQIESPFIDCSISPSILMYFDHYFVGGNGGSGKIEVYDGTNWNTAATYTDSTVGVESVLLDISSYAGGITNAKVRLEWEGDSSYYWAVDNLQIYAPLTYDAAITTIQNPVMPFSAATQNIEVDLINSGAVTMTTATIKWTVNGISQNQYDWTGSLSMGTSANNIVIGSYTFPDGVIQNIKVWVEQPNGQQDLNALNDTTQAALAAGLCGNYTIGGVNPDFLNFTDAAYVLNNAGISCPVVFNVRDTIYDEQIKIYDVQGSSSVNTITFNGESGDSSVAGLHYQNSNPSNDFTLGLVGTHNIFFNDLTIDRSNGTYAMLIQGGAHDVTVTNSKLGGDVMSPRYSVDSVLTFVGNNMESKNITLHHPVGTDAGKVVIENNYLNDIVLNNASEVNIKDNSGNGSGSRARDFRIDSCKNITLLRNNLRGIYFHDDTILNLENNSFYGGQGDNITTQYWDVRVLLFVRCNDFLLANNSYVFSGGAYGYCLDFNSSSTGTITNDSINHIGQESWGGGGKIIRLQSSNNIEIKNNYLGLQAQYYIGMDVVGSSDSIYIKNNTLLGNLGLQNGGRGFNINSSGSIIEIDSNLIIDTDYGIYINSTSSSKVRNNVLQDIDLLGIEIQGDSGVFTDNIINSIVGGNGISINGNGGANVSRNKILGVTAGSGIVVNAPNSLVANNYVQSDGVGLAKGISLEANGSGSDVVFNSVNVTGTDVVNGQGITVNGGTNYRVKNNIFANNGGGYAAYINSDISTFDWDFNDYYSTKNSLAFYLGTSYDTLSSLVAASGKDSNSLSVNPLYTSTTDLSINHTLLNNVATPLSIVSDDIDGTSRLVTPDIGAKEYSPCAVDAGINEIVGIAAPIPTAGPIPVEVVLQNQGTTTLTSATIQWEINGVLQTPYSWTGSLLEKESVLVTLGSYQFINATSYDFKIYTDSPNGIVDCAAYNDTTYLNSIFAGGLLCGVYTIGGVSPDFLNFTDAAYVLNNVGISCPVVFNVRDTIYDEQIKIYDVQGSSSVNTITFNGESGDSSVAGLHYQNSNPSNDFTLGLVGTHNIFFNDLTIDRSNGTYAMLIQGGAHDVTVTNSKLGGDVMSPRYSVDSVLTFVGNNMESKNITLHHPVGTDAGKVVIENNYLNDIVLNNASEVNIKDNSGNGSGSRARDFRIDSCKNITLLRNNLRGIYFHDDTILNLENNSFYGGQGDNITTQYWDVRVLLFVRCNDFLLANNSYVFSGGAYGYCLDFNSSSTGTITNDSINHIGQESWGGGGKIIRLQSSNNIEIKNNYLGLQAQYYIGMDVVGSSDSIYIKNNTLLGNLGLQNGGRGFNINSSGSIIEIDSNLIIDTDYGIYINSTSSSKVRNNVLQDIDLLGIEIQGDSGVFTDNIINSIVGGNGISINGNGGANVSRNKILGVTAGSGIVVNAPNSLVANNYVQSDGVGLAKGISLEANGSGSDVVFNSVNVTGTDVVNGQGITVNGGTNYRVKNNIFANNGGGYAAYINSDISTFDWDFNDYYSSGTYFGNYQGTSYNNLNAWGPAVNADANSYDYDPNYVSTTDLMIIQRQLNGAGINVGNVIDDIDGDLRNLQAPDVGAQEISADFGLTQLLRPGLDCFHTDNEFVEIVLRQYGDLPFINQQVAYQVNGGPIKTEVIPGTNFNDIFFTFSTTEDLSLYGTYEFKFWLVNNSDENVNNDTLYRTIYRDDVPFASFTANVSCANESSQFTGTGSVTSGSISGYEWIFGDGDTSLLQNPVHVFDSSGSYDVNFRVYSSLGCFGDTSITINLNATPNADFSYNNVCEGDSMNFISLTTVDTGTVSYNWSFGDGQTSTNTDPNVLFADSGTFNTTLVATSSVSGCHDTIIKEVKVFKSYSVSNNIDTVGLLIFNGNAYTESDTVTQNFQTSNGCDSIVTTFITINPFNTNSAPTFSSSPITTASLGANYIYDIVTSDPDGDSVTISALQLPSWLSLTDYGNDSALLTGSPVAGIDSVILQVTDPLGNFSTQIFTISVNYNTTVYDTICDGYSYNFNGTLLSNAGSYYDTLNAVNSLDSIITLNLSQINSATNNVNTNLCFGDSLLLQGGYQTTAGTYYDTIISGAVSGCDSVLVTNLTILPLIFSDTVFATACDSLIWEGSTYISSGIYNDTLTSITGCDSILTLNLSINYSISSNDSLVACDSAVWNGNTYNASGVYVDTLQTISSCDSIITLNLTINNFSSLSLSSTDSLICYGDSVQLIASGAQNYSWQTSYNISSLTITNPMVYPLIDTSYVLTATDSLGCSSSDSILISVIPPYLLDLGGTIDTCIGSVINLQPVLTGGTGNNTTTTWSPGNYFTDSTVLNSTFASNSSMMVYLNLTDTLEGCVVNDSLMININNPVANAGNDLDTCYGTSLILNGSGAGLGGSYLWSPSNSLNYATIANPLTVLDSSIQFVLQVSDSIGCTDNDTVQISVFSSSFLTDSSICEGDSLNIELFVDTIYNPSFSWSPNFDISNTNSSSVTIYTDSSTTYSYLATSNNGCIFSDTLTVNVYNAKAIIDTTLLTGCEGVTMVFDNGSDESLNYYWIVDEMDSLFDISNDLIYNFGDRVDVALYVENSNGCYDSTSIDFYLEGFDDYFQVSLPNVFTPNYDGDNDIFRVDMAGKLNECSELSIFNRWGQLVYSSNGRTPEWNGKNYSGLDVPTGQYYFQLLIKEKSFGGKLYLFR